MCLQGWYALIIHLKILWVWSVCLLKGWKAFTTVKMAEVFKTKKLQKNINEMQNAIRRTIRVANKERCMCMCFPVCKCKSVYVHLWLCIFWVSFEVSVHWGLLYTGVTPHDRKIWDTYDYRECTQSENKRTYRTV